MQCHGVAVTCQVAGEVCAHDSKAGDTNLCLLVFSHVYKDTRLGQAIYRWSAVLCPKESQFRLDYLRELPAGHPRGRSMGQQKPGKQKPRHLAVPGLAVGPTGIEPMTSTV